MRIVNRRRATAATISSEAAEVSTGDTATTRGDEMARALFAGIPVTDYAATLPWYEQFFGGRPSLLPNDTEAVWEVTEHRYIYNGHRRISPGCSALLIKTGRLSYRWTRRSSAGRSSAA